MLLPHVQFGAHRISRLVIGGNPLRGNSHLSEERSREMKEYYTAENVLKAWFDPSITDPRTIHHHGEGVFKVDGETIKLPSHMK